MSAFKLGGLLGAGIGKLLALPALALEALGFNALALPIRLAAYVGLAALLAAGSRDFLGTTLYLAVVIISLSEYFRHKIHVGDGKTGHVRGNELVTVDAVKKMVAGEKSRFSLGEVPIPEKFENRHFLFAGTTGSGKTRLFHQLLQPARKTAARAVIVDIGGAMISRYHEPQDVILNPRDARTVDWSPLAEINDIDDIPLVVASIIPEGQGNEKSWNGYARRLMSAVVQRVWEAGGTNGEIIRLLTRADIEELRQTCAGLPAEGLLRSDKSEMLNSTMSIIASYLTPLQMLNPDAGCDAFSVAKWVSDGPEKSWLYLNFQDRQIETLKPLICAIVGISISSLLSLREDPDRRFFFILDEADALGEISNLKALLTRGRRFGASAVLAIQSISQLYECYGRDVANTLCANLGTQVILRLPDAETSEWASRLFGDEQLIEAQHSENSREFGTERGENTSYQMRTQRVVMASDVANLPDLVGVLNIVGDVPPCVINVPPINPPQLHEEFIRKTA